MQRVDLTAEPFGALDLAGVEVGLMQADEGHGLLRFSASELERTLRLVAQHVHRAHLTLRRLPGFVGQRAGCLGIAHD